MAEIWWTSDTHFFHKKLAEVRGFDGIEEMNELIRSNWNDYVAKDDTVWFLGDFSLGTSAKTADVLTRLNGHIHLVKGNHDRDMKGHTRKNFASVRDYGEVKIDKQLIVMSHYPFAVWRNSHYGSWHVHGHSHGSLAVKGRRVDVCTELHHYAPINYERLRQIMAEREVSFEDYHRADMVKGEIERREDG